MTQKVLIVIPYLAKEKQGNELELCVAGWRKHFKSPYHITLVGDYHKIVETGDDISLIRCRRLKKTSSSEYLCHLDFVNKFKAAHAAYPDTKGFIFCCDDYYAINDFGMNDILQIKYCGESNFDPESKNHWRRDKAKTAAKLREEGYTTHNFTTHLPQYYEWDKLEILWDKYDMANTSYVFEDLYYNIYHSDDNLIPLRDDDDIKLSIQDKNVDAETIRNAFATKKWINNSINGWSPILQKLLEEHYEITKS